MKTRISVLAFILFSTPCMAKEATPPPRLSAEVLPATGNHSSILSVQRFGRYAITAHSRQGTALQVVDRMAGPGDINGVPGEKDGRLDLFLNRGEYKIITHAHETGNGEVKLVAHAFAELNKIPLPQLVKLKNIHLTLADFQQRSFWLNINQRQTVAIEAAGRNLADMRLWKDGNWLLDVEPTIKLIYPHPDKPLQVAQLNTTLEPGLYLLTTYGGPSQAWTVQSDEHPLYIRYGIPRLDVAGQQQHKVSVFGTDRYLVPGNSNYFNLSVPEATAVSMTVATFQELNAFDDSGDTATISKKSIPPTTELDLYTQSADRVITVTALAGQSYILQQFEKRWQYTFSEPGRYWLSSIHSGNAKDSVDATSVLTRWRRFATEQFVDTRAVKLNRKSRYERRFNLLDELTLYLEVTEAGNYIVSGQGEGVKAEYRIEPFLTSRPRDYQSPPFRESGYRWNLDAGFYVLTAKPELKGILTLTVEKEGFLHFRDSKQSSVAGATRYGPISLSGDRYTLYLNRQPGVKSGVVLRPLPIDLSTALPVTQFGGERLTIAVRLPEAGTVQAITTSGKPLPISRGKARFADDLTLDKGRYDITVRNTDNHTVNYSLQFAATRLSEAKPLPPIDENILSAIPDFPTLTDKRPEYFDLDRKQPATYLVKVNKPALYRLESSGLLETEGNLRTRTIPSLIRQQSNGVGRNFLIQQYLREGVYQLTLQPRHKSRGHLGLSLSRTSIEDGGLLSTDVAVRATLKAGKGLLYRFSIKNKGTYRLRAIGVNRTYVMRVEDAQGWPIVKPNIAADLSREFQPGEYRVIIRPEAVDARVVTTLEAVREPAKYTGHGPHPIALNQPVNHEWQEPAKGERRTADTWTFELPAAADTTISLTSEMQGKLFSGTISDTQGNNNNKNVTATVSPVKPWQGKLAAGRYRLAVKNLRHNNHVDYQLQVTTRQLVTGQQRQIRVPASIPLSIGNTTGDMADNGGGLVELYSYGQSDVRAELYDDNNTLVANNDDRDNDWNFLIAQALPAGQYRLQVDALGQAQQPTTVFMRTPGTHLEDSLSLPAKTIITDTEAHIFPLSFAAKGVLAVQADSDDSLGVSVERSSTESKQSNWRVLATDTGKAVRLLLPVNKAHSQSYRLRVWSVDRRGASITLNAQAVEPAHYGERQWQDITLTPLSGAKQPFVAMAAVNLSHPGVLQVENTDSLLWSYEPDRAFKKVQNGLMTASGDMLWIAKLSKDRKALKTTLSRIYLSAKDRTKDYANDKAKGRAKLQVIIPPAQVGHVDLKLSRHHANAPILAIAQSRAGQPGVQIIDKNNIGKPQNAAQGLAIAQQSVVSMAIDSKHPVVKLWNAGGQDALEVDVRQMRFNTINKLSAAEGDFQYPLPAAAALELALSNGRKRVNLVFPPDTAAALMSGDKIISTHWSGKTSLNEVSRADIDKIVVLNAAPKTQTVRLVIESLPQAASLGENTLNPNLTENHIFQQRVTNVGLLRLPVNEKNTGKEIIRVRGQAQAAFIQADGRILQGRDLTINGDGVLILDHRTGVVMAWLESPQKNAVNQGELQTLNLDSPKTITLQGITQAFRLDIKHALQLQLRSDTPLITRITYPGGRQIIQAHPNGVNYSPYLPEGVSSVELQGIGSAAMNGSAFVSAIPVQPIQEGQGPESILSGGATRLYGFEVKQAGPVGLGVQASTDVVSGVLMDQAGTVIGHGALQMPQLQPGHYVFAVSVPQNSLPVRLHPALVGLEKPPTGPPAEVIKSYLDQSGLKMNR